jgi:hypothetical protein
MDCQSMAFVRWTRLFGGKLSAIATVSRHGDSAIAMCGRPSVTPEFWALSRRREIMLRLN